MRDKFFVGLGKCRVFMCCVDVTKVQLFAMASPGRQGGAGAAGGALSTRGGTGARRLKWALELSLGNTR